jgi:orotate phosphoribosyltransferase
LGLQVAAIASLTDLLGYLGQQAGAEMAEHLSRTEAYRQRYGVV